MDMNLAKFHQRNMMFCEEWYVTRGHFKFLLTIFNSCSIPIFANDLYCICKHCEKIVALRFNPRIVCTYSHLHIKLLADNRQISKLADETGTTVCGKLIFSDEAWEQLLGMPPEMLARQDLQQLKDREYRILFLRITVLMGWNPEVGKTSVLRVME